MSIDGNVAKPQQDFSGKILDFNLGGVSRKHIVGVIKYGQLRQYTESNPFDSKTGEGEQRNVIERHAKQIQKCMRAGKFSPTALTLGTRKHHRDAIQYKDKKAALLVDLDKKLPVLDGGNRMYALEEIRREGDVTARLIDNLYIPYILYLDGDTKEDFVNLQAGKPVSRDHILSMRIANGLLDPKHKSNLEFAKSVAEILHDRNDSFCKNLVQFDSNGSKLPLSLNTICTKAGSDLAFSLYGGAKIAIQHGKDVNWLAHAILEVWRAIKKDPETSKLVEKGNILCPIGVGGTKAGTSLLIGLGNMLAAKCLLTSSDDFSDDDVKGVLAAAINHLDLSTSGNTSADRKRAIFHNFCLEFFASLRPSENNDEENDEVDLTKNIGFHEDIPVILIRLLSPSTFHVSRLPSDVKRGRKPKAVVQSAIIEEDKEDDEEIDQSSDDPDFTEEDSRADEVKQKLEAENLEEDVIDEIDSESDPDEPDKIEDFPIDKEETETDIEDEVAPWEDPDEGGF